MRLGILISGRGSNMVAIARAVASGEIPDSEVAVVISNKGDAPGLQRALELGLKVEVVERKGRRREDHDKEIVALLERNRVEFVCLAGYMRLLSTYFVESFRNRIVNIHPSLLPSFPGINAIDQAFEYGVKVSGCTVHFVDEELDHGPIIEQTSVPVLPEDDISSLIDRIHHAEHKTYVSALKGLVTGRFTLDGRRYKHR